ncbi:MAG: hypothetical protein ACJASL_003867 [Paraglaciecola sp.]|jgi:hypothetical protein
MTYTINGKQYTEFDINKRCAELMDLKDVHENNGRVFFTSLELQSKRAFEPCSDPTDTWPIIDKCWDELTSTVWQDSHIYWDLLIDKHNCTKLVAACICYIELNE